MSFLKIKKSGTASGARFPHRIRIQMSGAQFPCSSFELGTDIYETSLSSVVELAAVNIKQQAAASGFDLDGGLYCSTVPFKLGQNASGSYRNLMDVPRITDLSLTANDVGLNHNGTLYVVGHPRLPARNASLLPLPQASSKDIEAKLATHTMVYDTLAS